MRNFWNENSDAIKMFILVAIVGLVASALTGCERGGLDASMDQPDLLVTGSPDLVQTPDLAPKPFACTMGEIHNYGVGGEMALITARGGFALAYAIGNGPNQVSPYYSTLRLLDQEGGVRKSIALGLGEQPQLARGKDDMLTTFQTGGGGFMARARMAADGSQFVQERFLQGPFHVSPVYISDPHVANRYAYINVQPGTGCPVVNMGETLPDGSHGGGIQAELMASQSLREGRCLPNGTNWIHGFAVGGRTKVIAVQQQIDDKTRRSSLFFGDATYEQNVVDQWQTGERHYYTYIQGIKALPQGGFLAPSHRFVGDKIDPTRFIEMDETGKPLHVFEVPYFKGWDADGERIVTVSWGDDNTKSAFFHLMDKGGKSIKSLKLETRVSDWNVTAQVVIVDDHTFFAVWGGGITAADSLSEIKGAVVTCK